MRWTIQKVERIFREMGWEVKERLRDDTPEGKVWVLYIQREGKPLSRRRLIGRTARDVFEDFLEDF